MYNAFGTSKRPCLSGESDTGGSTVNTSIEHLYAQRLDRYVTAMRNGMPDRVPVRPFAAEFTAKYAGYTCQDVTHDYQRAFAAMRKCAGAFDWDAVPASMVYVWTGLTEAIGIKYYGVPGIDVPPDTGFQYREPPEAQAFMQSDEYDALIADPTKFLLDVWLPRVSNDVVAPGSAATSRSHLSFLKGGMAMLSYFNAFGTQIEQLKRETGTVSAIAGILKAPFDILADKLRGYVGLTMDMIEQPEKVLAACEALMPHLLHVALSGADPDKKVPIGFWMHRGCVPFVSGDQFRDYYWPTLQPIIEALWARGHQVLFYAEGNWDHHLDTFGELPDGSIVFHVDRSSLIRAHEVLGGRFCLSGGIPNYLLTYGTPDDIRDCIKRIIDTVARDGGYIMDASAIIQNDATEANIRLMTEFTHEYGVYGAPSRSPHVGPSTHSGTIDVPVELGAPSVSPGVCVPWEEKLKEIPSFTGNRDLVRQVWEQIDELGYQYLWHCLLSF